jgi:hypothetical protein
MKVASSKWDMPAIESRLAPKPKPSNLRRLGEPVGKPSYGPFSTRASMSLPSRSALIAKMAVAVVLMDCGTVADAPVDKQSAACHRHATRADSAERKSDVLPPGAPIDKTGIDLGFGFLRDDSVHARLSAFDSA